MKQKILPILIMTIILTGCGSQKTVVKKYYTLEQPEKVSKPFVEDSVLFNARCEVGDVNVYPAYSSRRIVCRDDSHQIRYFGEHEWAVPPSTVLTPMIIDFLSAKNLFLRVSDRFWEHTPEYRLNTTVFEIEVGTAEGKKDFTTHLTLKFELIDTRSGTSILTHISNRKSTLEKRNLNLMAESISDLFYEELENFAQQIRETLSAQR
ncbi:MAG: hypothetical protein JG782_1376 [Anaerophaga sp.]|uniref:ABC-type transport auxiliary lipoprotein family protein n=1 Tax=Anaerophaga thermohalophila TaxID=177400 RepID=UPI000237CF8F|nr:ABC-type transport auxiliary lipoprotein family protein [Anaerophaga thermohalophila]MBZ4676756.1 hypothetical protein [Anaerophaga sp.]MDK2841991.1 cholesterol transport system auxiliary component [Anaerophaga sp.]MDN5291858.1 cholesterol transport system auxiliary component [Anaerophaga sp.]